VRDSLRPVHEGPALRAEQAKAQLKQAPISASADADRREETKAAGARTSDADLVDAGALPLRGAAVLASRMAVQNVSHVGTVSISSLGVSLSVGRSFAEVLRSHSRPLARHGLRFLLFDRRPLMPEIGAASVAPSPVPRATPVLRAPAKRVTHRSARSRTTRRLCG